MYRSCGSWKHSYEHGDNNQDVALKRRKENENIRGQNVRRLEINDRCNAGTNKSSQKKGKGRFIDGPLSTKSKRDQAYLVPLPDE